MALAHCIQVIKLSRLKLCGWVIFGHPYTAMLQKLLSVAKVAKGPDNVKFLIVAIDYFTKWVEDKAVRTITGVQVQNFVWEYIVCRFSIPRELVSDNGAQIVKEPFKIGRTDLNIVQKFTSVAHPHVNGLCEVTNCDIVSGIKKRLYEKRTGWVDELPNHRVANFDEEANGEGLCENLNLIEERRLMATIREVNNKQQIAKYYNKTVRALSFDVGEWVLRNNDASRAEKLGKLGPNWEGPYQVVAINSAGSYKLADIEGRTLPNAWHASLLKRDYA
ncbi:uncharacterized protein [Rutidosis leptorrhynchoides]|uniref:uncharacterized protein n=1 Tax=Rutidosis leptorrhynchoides TaxID=125765 RepID=UPI003A991513